MSYRQIKVRSAIDTVMDAKATFDLANIRSENYDATAKKEAVNLHWFIKNNCSVAFYDALQSLFVPKSVLENTSSEKMEGQ